MHPAFLGVPACAACAFQAPKPRTLCGVPRKSAICVGSYLLGWPQAATSYLSEVFQTFAPNLGSSCLSVPSTLPAGRNCRPSTFSLNASSPKADHAPRRLHHLRSPSGIGGYRLLPFTSPICIRSSLSALTAVEAKSLTQRFLTQLSWCPCPVGCMYNGIGCLHPSF